MTGEKKDRGCDDGSLPALPRRGFVALSLAAGLGATARSAARAERPVIETNVEVKTPDGICDAAFFHPAKGSHPGVLMWPDSGGLRPAFRELGRRIAAAGYSALVPNHLYRTAKAPVFDESFNPVKNPADRGKYRRITAPFFAPGAAERDADAYAAFLDAQQQVNRKKKLGVHGYCLGGIHVMKTAAAFPPAAAQACRSTAVYWPPTSPTARTCSRRGSRRGCILRLRPMTTSASRR